MDYDTTPAGPVLDQLVAEKVMGWRRKVAVSVDINTHGSSVWRDATGGEMARGKLPAFSTDIGAAVGLMPALFARGIWVSFGCPTPDAADGDDLIKPFWVVTRTLDMNFAGRDPKHFVEDCTWEELPTVFCHVALKAVEISVA